MTARSKGYTLIELLLVIAILGISSTLLIPYIGSRDAMKTQSAVRMLIGDLSFAQSDALSHQEIRRVHFYEDGRGYCVVRVKDPALPFDADTAEYIFDPLAKKGEVGSYIVDLSTDDRFKGVTFTKVEIDGDTLANGCDLHYDELGGTLKSGGGPGTGGFIQMEMGLEKYRITIAPFTGKLTVEVVED